MASNGCPDYITPPFKPDANGLACSAALANAGVQGVSLPVARSRGGKHALVRFGRLLLVCLLMFVLGACQARGTTAAGDKPPAKGTSVLLTLHGYNYTDHYIDSYSVNGMGGGNLFVSTPTAGGGGGACCVRWLVGQALPVKVHVRWESSECTYVKNVEGEDFPRAKSFYTEKDVWLTGPIPVDPQYFETHFYPDGRVEVAVTDTYSPPRLKLPDVNGGIRPGAKPWPKCSAEQMKQGAD